MHRAVLVIFVIGMLSAAAVAFAQMQPGSTGGNVGKQDKSVSGGNASEDSSSPHHSVAKGSSCGRIAGTWKWVLGTATVISSNGSANNSAGPTATWTCDGGQYVFVWSNGYTDHISLSTDGNRIDAVNNVGVRFSPTRF
jgi:hypothetical protein